MPKSRLPLRIAVGVPMPPARFRLSPCAAAVLLMGGGPLAGAEEPARVAVATEQLGEVRVVGKHQSEYQPQQSTVGGKQPTAPRDIPQTVTVVQRAVLDAQQATTLNDALRNVPGITLGAGEGGQIGNNINLRGFSARTDIYLDGFRDRGQYTRDIFSLEAVEVLEGPSSLLFGRGSTGGVINQVSKRPQLEQVGDATLSLGTDDYYRGTFDVGHALSKTAAVRLTAMAQHVDGTRDVVQYKDWGVAPSLKLGIGTDTEVTLSLLSQHNDDVPDYGMPLIRFKGQAAATPIDVPRRRWYGYTNDDYQQDVNVLSIGIDQRLAPGLKLRSRTQYSDYRIDASPTPLGGLLKLDANGNYQSQTSTTVDAGTPLDALRIGVQQRDRDIHDRSLFNQTDLLVEAQTGALKHHLVVGAEVGRDTYDNDYAAWYNFNYNNGAGLGANVVDVFNLGAPPYSEKPSGANVYRVPGNFTRTEAGTFATYFNEQLDLGEHWKLIGGLRWDRYSADQDYVNYCYAYAAGSCPNVVAGSLANASSGLITGNTNPAQTAAVQAHNAAVLQRPVLAGYSTSRTDYRFSTRGGLIWQPDKVQSYYGSYGTSFNPLAEAVAGLPTNASADAQYQNGGGTGPEKTQAYEVGGKWELADERLSVSSALFRLEKTDARVLDPTTQTYTLAGNIRVDGAELKLVGSLSRRWQLIGGYTWLDGKIVSSPVVGNAGNAPQSTPRNTAALWSTYKLTRRWELGAGATYSTSVYTNNTATAQVPGYTRYDATAAYLARRWSLRLNLQNLGNETYYQSISAGRATPADGRRAILTFGYRFL